MPYIVNGGSLAHFNPNRYPDGRFAPKNVGSTLSRRDRRDAARLIKDPWNISDDRRTGLVELVQYQANVKDAEKQLADSEKSFYEFEAIGYERMKAYKLKALEARARDRYKYADYDPNDENDILEIMHGHWDTGHYSSFDFYLRDHGSSFEQFWKRHEAASNAYRVACREATDKLLGIYGHAKVFNKRTSVTERLAETAAWERILQHSPDEDDKIDENKRRGYTVRF